MPEEMREWRNPDSDHYMAEWIRGLTRRDYGRMALAEEKLDGMFGRATLTEGVVVAAGAESTGTAGPYIPRPLEAVVSIARDRVAKGRRFATIIQMTRQNHQIPTAGAMTAYMVAESTSGTQGEGSAGSVDLIAKTGVVKAIVTKEVLDDSAVNVINLFAVRGGGALGVLEDNQIFKDGTTGALPTGNDIQRLSGTTFSEATSTILGFSDVVGMYFGVPQEYRDNAVWLASSNVLQLMSAEMDAANGRPLYAGLVDAPRPMTDDRTALGTLMGRPVYQVPLTAGDIWFGDMAAQYALGVRQGIMVEVSEHVRFAEREVMFLISQRFAGANIDSSASQYAAGITSTTNAW
jgi:HK97 family phage major capsid protein